MGTSEDRCIELCGFAVTTSEPQRWNKRENAGRRRSKRDTDTTSLPRKSIRRAFDAEARMMDHAWVRAIPVGAHIENCECRKSDCGDEQKRSATNSTVRRKAAEDKQRASDDDKAIALRCGVPFAQTRMRRDGRSVVLFDDHDIGSDLRRCAFRVNSHEVRANAHRERARHDECRR